MVSSNVPPAVRVAMSWQEYPWGTVGKGSRVARYASATPENEFTSKDDGTYAELWMASAHQNGPSRAILPSGQLVPLKDFILENSQFLYGKAINRLTATARKRGQLPFLFKTLCAGKALPLQIHPDLDLARKMYEENPEELPDDNHKPEIGLALSEFWAFASFRPMDQIRDSVRRIPELKEALGSNAEDFLAGEASEGKLRAAVSAILQRNKDDKDARKLVLDLAKRCKQEGDKALKVEGADSSDAGLAEVFGMLNDDYEGDLGAFICAFFMNLYKLQPGEAIYVPADGIHAWFRGDCIECMANSDNVLNSAFTEVDPMDLKTFNENVLTPIKTPPEKFRVTVKPFDRGSGHTNRYFTPFSEFDMLRVQLRSNESEQHQGIQGPSVALCSEGEGIITVGKEEIVLQPGVVVLIAADHEASFKAGGAGMQVYRCFTEDRQR